MSIVQSPSPNHGPRPPGVQPDLIIVHGTKGTDAGDLRWCRTPKAEGMKVFGPTFEPVSYHYLIWRDGTIHQLVKDTDRAWHAGPSVWQGRDDCNDYSIGIGLSNKGTGEPFTDAQYEAYAQLLRALMSRWSIPWARVVGHQHVSPGRKDDPWLHFQWTRLFRTE